MNKQLFFFIFFLFQLPLLKAQKDSIVIRKEYAVTRAIQSLDIDGDLSDDAWKNVVSITDYKQSTPVFNVPATQQTEVKIIFDNIAIYVAAMLYDSAPDSIAHQLGNRDDELNADLFRIVFDTYNKQQDGFNFAVTASGVQQDYRFSDPLYDAVWESAVKLTNKGWSVEMKIPFSSLRFPNSNEQLWGFQITRNITRNGELDQWALTPKGESNFYKYWGILTGLKDIKEATRLSLTPYLTAYTSHFPVNIPGESNYTSNIVGGLDLKYGINESFTIDATLLPDFSQVQSDNVVKNLSAFEVLYDEQRPFFKEGTELFQKGDLFYSRRIGRKPSGYDTVIHQLNQGEKIKTNPDQAKLLNAAKVSGRTPNGFGIGILNAILNNTYAVIHDSIGKERRILTEPYSNYNIVVFDQQLKNSSSVYLINTNVNRKANQNTSDVTGAGFDLNNKKNTYGINGKVAVSNVFSKTDSIQNQYTDLYGYKYDIGINKTSGKFQFSLYRNVINQTFDNNDMGITNEKNVSNNGLNLSLNQFEPHGRFLNSNANLSVNENENFTTHQMNSLSFNLSGNATFRNHYSIFLGCDAVPTGRIDYYEPRTPGRIFRRTPGYTGFGGITSDYRKRYSIALNFHGGSTTLISKTIGYNPYWGVNLYNSLRTNDKLSFGLSLGYNIDNGDRGWVNTDEYGNIIFGVRKMNYRENILDARYLFRNNLSISLRARQYWVSAHYVSFHNLKEDGYLTDNPSYNQNHDFNFNAFNIDMVFQWQFAPGSSLNLIWKNSIDDESDKVIYNYSDNFNHTFQTDKLNTISLKVLYYFDYLYLRKKAKTLKT